jgi:hypothetical protein
MQPGNGASFLSLVEKLTGQPLTANAWVKELQTPTQQKVNLAHVLQTAPSAGWGDELQCFRYLGMSRDC